LISPIPNYEGFNITFQTTEDCNLQCSYCFSGDTKILMSDFSQKPIKDIVIGDEVMSFNENAEFGKHRRIYPTLVTKTFKREANTIEISTISGKRVRTTAEHPFLLKNRGWKSANKINKKHEVMCCSIKNVKKIDISSLDYKIGYIIASWLGEGSMFKGIDKRYNTPFRRYRFVVKDVEFIERVKNFLNDIGINFKEHPFLVSKKNNIIIGAVNINKSSEQDKFDTIIQNNFLKNNTQEYLGGFLAGIIDGKGSYNGNIRIFNSSADIIEQSEIALKMFGVRYTFDKPQSTKNKIVAIIRTFAEDTPSLLASIMNVIPRKSYKAVYKKCRGYSDKVDAVLPTGIAETVYNFETESHTYIANEFMVHNCYEINKRRNDLPLDYAKKFIDMILETDDPLKIRGTKDEWVLNQGLILDFIGGDSFMRPKLMDEILSYFQFKAHSIGHRWANRWRASISTNGTLFDNPEVRNLMIKYKGNISVGVSVDGCPQIHDKNRIFPDGSGSMDAILKWWDWYLDYVGIDNATTKATLNKDSIPYIYESIKYLHETMKLKHINMNFIFEEMNLTEDDYQEIEKQFDKSIDYIFEHREDLYVSMFSREFGCATKCEPDKLNTSWCGGGLMPCVTPSGDIFPCFRFTQITMEEGTELLKLGNVFDGWIDADKTTIK